MTKADADKKLNDAKLVIRELELVLKNLPVDFETHKNRLGMLQFLLERCTELHKFESSQTFGTGPS